MKSRRSISGVAEGIKERRILGADGQADGVQSKQMTMLRWICRRTDRRNTAARFQPFEQIRAAKPIMRRPARERSAMTAPGGLEGRVERAQICAAVARQVQAVDGVYNVIE